MGDQMFVEVPEELWRYLDDAGFDSVGSFRGPPEWSDVAQAVVAVANQGLGMGANLVTVLLAKDSIASFVGQLRAWIGQRSAGSRTEFAVDFTARVNGTESRIRITQTGASQDATTLDTEALIRLIASTMDRNVRPVRDRATATSPEKP